MLNNTHTENRGVIYHKYKKGETIVTPFFILRSY